jgi:lysophospholipase L1-like esterase
VDHPDWQLINAGVGGDTLKNVAERLATELDKAADYNFIVIEAGYNDIILPAFSKANVAFRIAFNYLIKKGRAPIEDPRPFEDEYLRMINAAKIKTNAIIILTTIGCINENLSAASNLAREIYNEKIRNIAVVTNSRLADVGAAFEIELRKTGQKDYFLKSFLRMAYLDKKYCKTEERADKLSGKRNLALTIDGIHLNTKGANIFRRVIGEVLQAGGPAGV